MSYKIQVIAKGNYFQRYGEELAHAFAIAGHRHTYCITDDTYEVIGRPGMDISVVVAPNVYNHEYVSHLHGKRIAILTEQLPHVQKPLSGFVVDRMRQFECHRELYHGYVEWSKACYEYLRAVHPELNIAHFVHGYVPLSTEVKQVKTKDCKWDICFLGEMSHRRKLIVHDMQELGLRVFPKHEDVWGDEKLDALRHSKLILNMHYAEAPESFEAHRIFNSTSVAARPIISERMNDNSRLSAVVPQCDYMSLPRFAKIMASSDQLDKIGLDIQEAAKSYKMSDLVETILGVA